MTRLEFNSSLDLSSPPSTFHPYFKALWFVFKDDWQSAHDIVDGPSGSIYALLHAIVHRMEGDRWNANYWYDRAGKDFPSLSVEDERIEILEYILQEVE